MGEHFVSIGGNRIRYLESGDSEDALVLIHGLGASADRWEFVAPILERRYRLIAPDLVGFGYSDKPSADYTPEFFADFLEDLFEDLGLKKMYLMGSSMGGQIAVEFAAKNPRLVDKLVLVSSSGMMKHSTPALDTYVMAALYPNKDTASEAFRVMSASREANARIVDSFVKRMRMPNAKMAFISTVLGLKNSDTITENLESLKSPVLIVWGSRDPVIPVQYAKEFASSIKDSNLCIMEGSGHTPFVDSPERFSEIVIEFLDTVG